MEELLERLIQINGISGALIVGRDGLIVESKGEILSDPDFVGATIAEFFTSAESIMGEKFTFGNLEKITIETSSGKYFLNSINTDTFLVIIANGNANLGLLRLEIKSATENLREILNA